MLPPISAEMAIEIAVSAFYFGRLGILSLDPMPPSCYAIQRGARANGKYATCSPIYSVTVWQ